MKDIKGEWIESTFSELPVGHVFAWCVNGGARRKVGESAYVVGTCKRPFRVADASVKVWVLEPIRKPTDVLFSFDGIPF